MKNSINLNINIDTIAIHADAIAIARINNAVIHNPRQDQGVGGV